ncbi:hypothetical protein AAFF_G00248990 [Aldrovandia affinis]|uniref:Uncharacterized protein n=1 Tax=Aldrovandia affinis TaxID=143900 RepID=A0AAD7RDB6_9TELE|nr:hypothetical protein AAFF_G00248990 [Aldrovandia affinis]
MRADRSSCCRDGGFRSVFAYARPQPKRRGRLWARPAELRHSCEGLKPPPCVWRKRLPGTSGQLHPRDPVYFHPPRPLVRALSTAEPDIMSKDSLETAALKIPLSLFKSLACQHFLCW